MSVVCSVCVFCSIGYPRKRGRGRSSSKDAFSVLFKTGQVMENFPTCSFLNAAFKQAPLKVRTLALQNPPGESSDRNRTSRRRDASGPPVETLNEVVGEFTFSVHGNAIAAW